MRALLAGFLALIVSLPAAAQSPPLTRVRFSLDWAFQGSAAPWLLAEQRGFFREEGIELALTSANGSSELFQRLATGTAEIGTADLAGMIMFNARNPQAALQAVMIAHNRSTVAIMATASSGIRQPADLRGKTVAGPESDAGRLLWPAFARAVGLPVDAITFTATTAALREPMLVRGQAQAMSGLTTSGVLNLVGLGVPRDQIVIFRYADYGVPLYGHSLMTRPGWAEQNPRLVTGIIRAMARGLRAAHQDPDAAIAALRAREPLVEPMIEKARMQLTYEEAYFTPDVLANGIGRADPARIAAMTRAVAEAFGIANPPAPETLYTDRYLPPAADLVARGPGGS